MSAMLQRRVINPLAVTKILIVGVIDDGDAPKRERKKKNIKVIFLLG